MLRKPTTIVVTPVNRNLNSRLIYIAVMSATIPVTMKNVIPLIHRVNMNPRRPTQVNGGVHYRYTAVLRAVAFATVEVAVALHFG